MRVLVVEDEERIAAFLMKGFKAHGYVVDHVTTAREAMACAAGFDLVVLDLGLPDLDGSEVLRTLRETKEDVPVIVLTARDDVDDIVGALDLGADDYLTKPFAFDVLLARVRARLRNRDEQEEVAVLAVGDLQLDLRTHHAHVAGHQIDLSTREFALLETFLRHPGQVLSRQQLLSRVWGFDFDPGSNVVDVYVRYLRHKVGPGYIATVRGSGYRLVQQPGMSITSDVI